ncbi:hypothetical protein GCM10023321_34820 [Pseudonocardia eucalypti]|uniref:AbiEi antitoxin C-terminal domain-containing protein n=1 Tax=Pseudonocardia eucalypti TaxID=648755 RepID=A0ABP9Q5E3_9PSEU
MGAPFRGSEAIAHGLLTRDQLYGPRFKRVFAGVFAPVDLALDLAARSRAAYLMVGGRGGVLVGYSAAELLGADCAPRDALAEVAVPVRIHAKTGLRIVHSAIDPADTVERDGCRVTTPLRTAWDLARRVELVEAVIAVDALARVGGFAPAELLARRAALPGSRGSRRLDQVVALADPGAASPMETRLRVGLLGAGLPAPKVQYEVRDGRDNPVARVDLAYPGARLAVEYVADEPNVPRQREGELADLGWQVVRVHREDVLRGMRRTADRVRAGLARTS